MKHFVCPPYFPLVKHLCMYVCLVEFTFGMEHIILYLVYNNKKPSKGTLINFLI